MVRIGYIGSTAASEYEVFASRNDAQITAIAECEGVTSGGDAAKRFGSADDLIVSGDIDAVVLALPADKQILAARAAASKSLPIYFVTPIADSFASASDASSELDTVITCVSRPTRLAVNLAQIRRTVIRYGAEWVNGRYVGKSEDGTSLVGQAEGIVDLVRFVGGNVASIDATASSKNGLVPILLTFLLTDLYYPEPVPVGVFRDIERPTYDDLVHQQIADAKELLGHGQFEKLFTAGETWEVT
jgi:predicted dehydrogenase